MQLMVVRDRQAAKDLFAANFNEALDAIPECKKRGERGRIAWVARRYSVSNEGAAKWLDARVIPDQANIARIAADLNVTPQWLHAGQLPKRPPPPLDPLLTELHTLWESSLDDDGKREIVKFARYQAGQPPDGVAAADRQAPPRPTDLQAGERR